MPSAMALVRALRLGGWQAVKGSVIAVDTVARVSYRRVLKHHLHLCRAIKVGLVPL